MAVVVVVVVWVYGYEVVAGSSLWEELELELE